MPDEETIQPLQFRNWMELVDAASVWLPFYQSLGPERCQTKASQHIINGQSKVTLEDL